MARKWRLYKFLVSMGVVSSKAKAADLARRGRISVNGVRMESLHFQIDPIKDVVYVNGDRVLLKENRKYFAFHKPVGVLCVKHEILEFFRLPVDIKNSLYPVGRLDKDTSGLLIVTNDGRIGNRVLNPKTKRKKVYEALVDGPFTESAAEKLSEGVVITTVINDVEKDYKTQPADVEILKQGKESLVRIGIFEGKKRQVRKMCEVVGFPVLELKRVSIARLNLENLKPGEYKEYDKKTFYSLLFE